MSWTTEWRQSMNSAKHLCKPVQDQWLETIPVSMRHGIITWPVIFSPSPRRRFLSETFIFFILWSCYGKRTSLKLKERISRWSFLSERIHVNDVCFGWLSVPQAYTHISCTLDCSVSTSSVIKCASMKNHNPSHKYKQKEKPISPFFSKNKLLITHSALKTRHVWCKVLQIHFTSSVMQHSAVPQNHTQLIHSENVPF